jgi:hypothetical protein
MIFMSGSKYLESSSVLVVPDNDGYDENNYHDIIIIITFESESTSPVYQSSFK